MLLDDEEMKIMAAAIEPQLRVQESDSKEKEIFGDFFGGRALGGTRIIELGPGHCNFARLATAAGATVVVMDHDPAVIALARKRDHTATLAEFLTFDWHSLRGQFDGLFARLATAPRWFAEPITLERFVDGVCSLLKPNGWAWVLPDNQYSDTPRSHVDEMLSAQEQAYRRNGFVAFDLRPLLDNERHNDDQVFLKGFDADPSARNLDRIVEARSHATVQQALIRQALRTLQAEIASFRNLFDSEAKGRADRERLQAEIASLKSTLADQSREEAARYSALQDELVAFRGTPRPVGADPKAKTATPMSPFDQQLLELVRRIPGKNTAQIAKKIASLLPETTRATALAEEKQRSSDDDGYLVALVRRIPAGTPQELRTKLGKLAAQMAPLDTVGQRLLGLLRPQKARALARLKAEVERRHREGQPLSWMNTYVAGDRLASTIVAAMEKDRFIPDVAIGHDTPSLETLDRLKVRFGTATIYDAMEMPILKERSGSFFRGLPEAAHQFLQPRIDEIVQSADRVITVGPALARRLEEIYHRKIEVVLNSRSGQPVARSDDLRCHVGAAEGDVLCLFGNLIAENYGFEEVVGALAHLPDRFKLVNIGGFGGEEYEQKTRKMIADTGYAHRILFGAKVSYDAIPNLFSGADLGIISFKPTLSENDKYALPNRLFDYCAAGVPIFTTRIEDIAHFVETYKAGLIFPDLTPKAIANSILSNLGNLEQWRANSALLGADVCWEKAGASFLESLDPPGRKIAIIIRRDIALHGRTHRAHRSLTRRGHSVRIFTTSGELPEAADNGDVVHVKP
jgi:glycosyltransferase involved in cell wall biosynthesis